MEFTTKLFEKISSYDLFNNFFPGLILCCIIEKISSFSFSVEGVIEKLFLYYFIGMILSRFGAIVVEKILRKVEWKNKKTGTKELFINYALYDDYITASEKDYFIQLLTEKNNLYRTMIAMFTILACVKIYECLSYVIINYAFFIVPMDAVFIIFCIAMIILFAFSYRRQTDYIRHRVERVINSSNNQG